MIEKNISFDRILKDSNKPFIAFIIFLIIGFSTLNVTAQPYKEYPYPTDVFRNPLGIDWKLSGTFGEPRGNHFHAGDDIKTNGATGYKLYSIDDGYVSRIKVSPYGYGKALYIAHPSGYTSVYGHMSQFNDRIDSIVEHYQYATKQFSQDIYFGFDDIKVARDEIIGLSGNSGGSAGPHLHFEIRETASQHPINPLFFGYKVEDTKAPTISGIKITGIPNGQSYYDVEGKRYDLEKNEKGFFIRDTIQVAEGRIGVGVHGFDQQSLTYNKNGIFRMEMFVNDDAHFTWTMDKMSFDQGRYVNAFRDFYDRKYNRTIYNCYRLPGNYLNVYEYQVDNGFVITRNSDVIKVNVVAWDFHQNKSHIEFYIQGNSSKNPTLEIDSTATLIKHNENSSISKDGFKAYIPSGTFYDDVQLSYQKTENIKSTLYSDIHKLHHRLIPMHKSAVIQIAPKNLPDNLKNKVVMVHKDLKNVEQALSTFWKDDMITAKCREVGSFYAKLDTTAPQISLVNFTSKTKTFRGEQIRVKISDNLSGIEKYNGYLDDNWVVFDYDAKRNLLTYKYDKYCSRGEHVLKIVVTDERNNSNVVEQTFIR